MKPISLIAPVALLGLLLAGPAGTQAQPQRQQQSAAAGRASRSNQPRARLAAANANASATPTTTNGGRALEPTAGFLEDELPADFYEMPAEQLDLGMNATGTAPVPILNVAVLQNGQLIDNAVTVQPGTPLEMVIYLDDKSAKVYGLLASYLKVRDDTFRQREETIILNGCSIDTYIFGNFEQSAEDGSLRARFRAFKFPESNFVRFIGTVNVCIKQCARVNCGPGAGGPQQRRQRRSPGAANEGRLVQLTVSTVLRIADNKQKAR